MLEPAAKVKAAHSGAEKDHKKQKSYDESGQLGWGPKLLAGFFLMSTVGGGLFTLYDALFPDLPSWADVTKKSVVDNIFYSGKPTLVLCENKTTIVEKVSATSAHAGV